MRKNLFSEFANFAPDEGGGGAPAAPAAPATPAAPSEPAPSTPSVPSTPPSSGAPSTPASGTGATTGAPAAPASPPWLESFRAANLPVGRDEKETIALISRINQERQALESVRPLVGTLQEFRQHAAEFQKWRAEQQKAQAAAKQQDPKAPAWSKFWSPPEYNAEWLGMVQKDANGNLMPAPGAPADIVNKLQAFNQYRTDQMQKFTNSPYEFMDGYIEQRATEVATKLLEDRLQKDAARQNAATFIDQNQGWLYEMEQVKDQAGNVISQRPRMQMRFDPNTGQQVQVEALSPWGQRMQKYAMDIRAAQEARNYYDQNEIQTLAFEKVKLDYAMWQLGEIQAGRMQIPGAPAAPAAPPVSPQDAANKKFIDKANPPGARQPGGGNAVPAETPITNKNFRQELLRAFKEAGLTDEVLK